MAMNLTVVVSPALRAGVDGRLEIVLGVPSAADIGDVVTTLLQLYPRLRGMVASDNRVPRRTIQLLLSERGMRELARGGSGLHEGEKLLLVPASGGSREDPGYVKG